MALANTFRLVTMNNSDGQVSTKYCVYMVKLAQFIVIQVITSLKNISEKSISMLTCLPQTSIGGPSSSPQPPAPLSFVSLLLHAPPVAPVQL